MASLDSTLRTSRRGWNRALAFSLIGKGVGIGLLFAGSAILVGRVLGFRWDLVGIGLGIGAGLVWAVVQARKRRVTEEQVAVWLDLKQGGDGRLLHQMEGGPTAKRNLPEPQLRPDYARLLRVLVPGLAFCLITTLVPVRAATHDPNAPLLERRLQEVEEMAAALEETLQLEEEVEEEIEENLAALHEANEGKTPSTEAMREALDRFEARLEEVAQQEAERLEQTAHESAQAAMDALSANPEQQRRALQELAEMAAEMESAKELQERDYTQQVMDQLKRTGLSQEQLEALQDIFESAGLEGMESAMEGLDLPPELAARLAQAMADALTEEMLEKLAELAEQGLLQPREGPGPDARMPTAEEIEEFLKMLEEMEPGGG